MASAIELSSWMIRLSARTMRSGRRVLPDVASKDDTGAACIHGALDHPQRFLQVSIFGPPAISAGTGQLSITTLKLSGVPV